MSLQHRLAYRSGKLLSGLQSWAPTSSTESSPCTQELRECICIDECRQLFRFCTVWPPQVDSCCIPGATACPEGLIQDRLDHLSKQHCSNEMLIQPAKSWLIHPQIQEEVLTFVYIHLSGHSQNLRPWIARVQHRKEEKKKQHSNKRLKNCKGDRSLFADTFTMWGILLHILCKSAIFKKSFLFHMKPITEVNPANDVLLA